MSATTRPFTAAAAGVVAAAATVVAATPVIPTGPLTAAPAASVSSQVVLLANVNTLGSITTFLDNNKALVLGVAANIPSIPLGPITVGDAVLANAYYGGFNGSAAGAVGVLSYVTDQLHLGTPADIVKPVVLNLTSQVPQFNVGPVKVGGSLLANAYFNGYNGSATKVPGVVAYVGAQLRPAASVGSAAVLTARPSRSTPGVPGSAAARKAPKAAASVTARAAAPKAASAVKAAASTRGR